MKIMQRKLKHKIKLPLIRPTDRYLFHDARTHVFQTGRWNKDCRHRFWNGAWTFSCTFYCRTSVSLSHNCNRSTSNKYTHWKFRRPLHDHKAYCMHRDAILHTAAQSHVSRSSYKPRYTRVTHRMQFYTTTASTTNRMPGAITCNDLFQTVVRPASHPAYCLPASMTHWFTPTHLYYQWLTPTHLYL